MACCAHSVGERWPFQVNNGLSDNFNLQGVATMLFSIKDTSRQKYVFRLFFLDNKINFRVMVKINMHSRFLLNYYSIGYL